MHNEKPTLEESYGRATTAGNLSQDSEHRAVVDLLTAAGMVGWRNSLALALWRLQQRPDPHLVGETLLSLAKLLRKAHARDLLRWRGMNQAEAKHVAAITLAWWLSPTCEKCHGRGYQVIPGTPTLSDIPCPCCHGGRTIPLGVVLRARVPADHVDAGRWLHGQMTSLLAPLSRAMAYKLKLDAQETALL